MDFDWLSNIRHRYPLLCVFCLKHLEKSTLKASTHRSWISIQAKNHGTKERFVKNAQALNLDGMPTIARRRNSDSRYQRLCEDMVDIIIFIDEPKALSLLLRYVFDYSDHFCHLIQTKETCACYYVS